MIHADAKVDKSNAHNVMESQRPLNTSSTSIWSALAAQSNMECPRRPDLNWGGKRRRPLLFQAVFCVRILYVRTYTRFILVKTRKQTPEHKFYFNGVLVYLYAFA
jgi:hypothetical protein